MEPSLLQTRIHVPSNRSEVISRRRLMKRLQDGAQRRLTLLSAPAGFGKTTLLCDWISNSEVPTAWLSLDPSDNDIQRFLTYLIASIQVVEPGICHTVLSALQSTQVPSTQAVLTHAINQISGVHYSMLLVLDDVHHLHAPEVFDAIDFLLAYMPSNLHLVLGTRADPPLALARLRARGELLELRDDDLRFSIEETSQFLNQASGFNLSDDDAFALGNRTEGWIAGLQMAALSMRGRDQEELSRFIHSFTGSHRFVLDFLTEEVLDRQSEDVKSFLLQSSILSQMCGDLCDAVIGGEDGNERLRQLDAENIFIVGMDDDRRWYRYHHLFAELLRNRLRSTARESMDALNRRASAWYAENGFILEAVEHAFHMEDASYAGDLVEKFAFPIMNRGELRTVKVWLEALPESLVRNNAWLSLCFAWCLMHLGETSQVDLHLQDALRARTSDDARTLGMIEALRTYLLASRGEIPDALDSARFAMDALPGRDAVPRAFVASILGSLHRFTGDFIASEQASTKAISISHAIGDLPMRILASCNLAGTQIVRGELLEAETTLRNALAVSPPSGNAQLHRLPFAGLASIGLAEIQREWNDLEDAEHCARLGIEWSMAWGQAEVLMQGYLQLAYVFQACKEHDEARWALGKAQACAEDLAPWTLIPLRAAEARLYLAQGDQPALAAWIRECGLNTLVDPDLQQMALALSLCRVLIASDDVQAASAFLERMRIKVETVGANGFLIEILAMQALASQLQGEVDQSNKYIRKALTLAEPNGYIRTFADFGPPMGVLLRRAIADGISPAYVIRILDAQNGEGSESSSPLEQPLVEPLSERELEVLSLIAEGYSNRQIANELVLAVGTVKKHVSNIYGKLQVGRRTEAVARARALKIL